MKNSNALFLAVALPIVLASVFPDQTGSSAYAIAPMLGMLFLLGVVLLRALKRREDLLAAIAVELNKLRRVYHLGKNLGESPAHRAWFTELHGYVYGYLSGFDKKSLAQYEETNGDFRKLSYHLYTISEPGTEKERVLYRELLEAAGTVAGARQRIVELWNGGLPRGSWSALTGLSLLAGAGVLSTVTSSSRLSVGISLAFLAAAHVFVRGADAMQVADGEKLANRYVVNLARLELKRHDETHG